MATVMKKLGGVRALVVGGCCELNTTAHELIVEIGSEMGAYNAAESGEDIRQCTALEINRVRQRLAVQIWRDYQEHAAGFPPLSGAKRIATLARSGQQACAGTCALRHHSRHNSAPALPPPSDDVRWGQSTPASSLIAREARPLAAASDLRRRLDRRWPRWRPT
jgi:hypothetical protein